MREPLIKYAYDDRTGELYDAEELFSTAKEGAIIREKYSRNELVPRCCECDQPLAVSMNSMYGHCFFKHLPNHSYCILSEENLTADKAEQYNKQARESWRHKYLKTKIGNKLKQTTGIEVNSISIDNLTIHDGEETRKPDVYCVYYGKTLVFEIQLSSLSEREILARTEFYKRKGIFLLWIRDSFDKRNQKMLDKDIKYLNKYQNVFQLNEEASGFELTCFYKKPFFKYDNEIRCCWESQNIPLKKLHFDEDFNVYFYDYQSEYQRLNEIAEERKRKQIEAEKLDRALTRTKPIIHDIIFFHKNYSQNFNSVKKELESLSGYEIEVFRKEFQKENSEHENLLNLLDNAIKLESAYYAFILSSPEVGIDFAQFKDKTLLMSVLANDNLWSNGQKVGWIVGKKALMDKKWGKKAVVRLVKRLSDSSLL